MERSNTNLKPFATFAPMIVFQSDKEQSLLDALHVQGSLKSASKARKWIKMGHVTVGGLTIKIPNHKLKSGEEVKVVGPNNDRSKPVPSNKQLDVIHEEEAFIVVDKPVGIPVIAKDKSQDSLVGRLYRYRRPDGASKLNFYAITRLDKKESGLVLIAKNVEAKNSFENIGVKKRWYALVEGIVEHEDGRIEIPMKLNTIKLWVEAQDGGMEAVTEYRVMKQGLGMSLLKVSATTEHKNQERAHLSMAGYPVVGDKRYGAKTNPINRMGMHLFSMTLEHPETGREVEYKTRVPKSLLNQVKLRNKKN